MLSELKTRVCSGWLRLIRSIFESFQKIVIENVVAVPNLDSNTTYSCHGHCLMKAQATCRSVININNISKSLTHVTKPAHAEKGL